MKLLDWHEYVQVMGDFRIDFDLPAGTSTEFVRRYWLELCALGVNDPEKLRSAMLDSREYAYEGWPPPVMLYLIIDSPEAARAQFTPRTSPVEA